MKFLWMLVLVLVLVGCGASNPQAAPNPVAALQAHLEQLDSTWEYIGTQFSQPQTWHDQQLVLYAFSQSKDSQSRDGVGYALLSPDGTTWEINRGETTGDPALMYSITIIREPLTNILYGRTTQAQATQIRVTTANGVSQTAPITDSMFFVEIPDNLATVELLDASGNVVP